MLCLPSPQKKIQPSPEYSNNVPLTNIMYVYPCFILVFFRKMSSLHHTVFKTLTQCLMFQVTKAVQQCCLCAGREEKYSSDGRPREKRKKRRSNTTTTCPFLKQGTLENFRDLALVGTDVASVSPLIYCIVVSDCP